MAGETKESQIFDVNTFLESQEREKARRGKRPPGKVRPVTRPSGPTTPWDKAEAENKARKAATTCAEGGRQELPVGTSTVGESSRAQSPEKVVLRSETEN